MVILGILLGIMTPIEAGAVGAFGCFIIVLIKRKFTFKSFFDNLRGALDVTGMIFLILIGAMILGYFFAITEIPFKISTFLVSLPVNRYIIIICIMVLYLILGCFLPPFSTMVITLPIFFPAVMTLGFDPVWYGVLMIATVEMGLLTPPVGINVFIVAAVAKQPIGKVYKGVYPFIIADFIAIVLIIAFPQISLFLPQFVRY